MWEDELQGNAGAGSAACGCCGLGYEQLERFHSEWSEHASSLYDKLELVVLPLFRNRNQPVNVMRHAIASTAAARPRCCSASPHLPPPAPRALRLSPFLNAVDRLLREPENYDPR